MPNAPQAPGIPCVPQLNWSHFKPEYSGKPDKDAEAHLLRMNDWMDKLLCNVKLIGKHNGRMAE